MKNIRTIGLCLTAVFALGVAAAGSASAELWPLWVPSSGHFPVHYTGLITTPTKLATAGGSEIPCQAVHYLGLLLNPHLADTHYLFLNCGTEVLGSALPCTGTGLASEQILLEADEHLGLIDDPSTGLFNNIGVLLLLPPGFKFTCGTGIIKAEIAVSGSVISQELSPLNAQRSTYEFLFKPKSPSHPLWTRFLSPLIGTVPALLLTSTNGGTEEESSREGGPGPILFLPAGETVELRY